MKRRTHWVQIKSRMFLAVLGKRMRVWERRLMKDFKVAPVATEEEMDALILQPPPENEDSISKYYVLSYSCSKPATNFLILGLDESLNWL